MTTLQVRIDTKLKKQAMKIAEEMGLDLSSAIKIFLVQMVLKKGIPFEIRTENGFTLAQERALLRDAKAAMRSKKSYANAHELFSDILGSDWEERSKRLSN